MRYGR